MQIELGKVTHKDPRVHKMRFILTVLSRSATMRTITVIFLGALLFVGIITRYSIIALWGRLWLDKTLDVILTT